MTAARSVTERQQTNQSIRIYQINQGCKTTKLQTCKTTKIQGTVMLTLVADNIFVVLHVCCSMQREKRKTSWCYAKTANCTMKGKLWMPCSWQIQFHSLPTSFRSMSLGLPRSLTLLYAPFAANPASIERYLLASCQPCSFCCMLLSTPLLIKFLFWCFPFHSSYCKGPCCKPLLNLLENCRLVCPSWFEPIRCIFGYHEVHKARPLSGALCLDICQHFPFPCWYWPWHAWRCW